MDISHTKRGSWGGESRMARYSVRPLCGVTNHLLRVLSLNARFRLYVQPATSEQRRRASRLPEPGPQ